MAEISVDKTPTQPSSGSNAFTKKLNKILESRLENDKDTLEALKALSTFFNENSLRTRRNLRGDIERRSLVINEEFLQSFKKVNDSLEEIYVNILSMNDCCEDMSNRLKEVKIQTSDLIDQTTKLQTESHHVQLKQEVVTAFLSAYQLKPEESKALRGSVASNQTELDVSFFDALARVKKIHEDCKVLLRTNQQTAGLEIMDCMATHLEAAFERLYRWTQAECRLQISESPEIPALVCQAMMALQERSVLFRYCIDEFASARRASVVRAFIDALTRGGPAGNPRPIEFHSHDPLRYVGDMLAWIHQATASEKECLEALLKSCSSTASEEHVVRSLNHIMDSICRPLRVRVEQVIVSEPGAVVLYRVANLLKFYHLTIKQVLSSEDAALLLTLDEMHILGQKMFLNSVQCHMTRLLEKIESPPLDLGPTDSSLNTLALLREILACHDSSVVSPDDKQRDFALILSCVIDPLLQVCALSAAKLNPADMAVFLVNSVYHIQSTLALYQYTDQRLEMLQAQMDAHLDTLVSEQVSCVLQHTGLGTIYAAVTQHLPKNGPLSQQAGVDTLAVKSSMANFDTFLLNPDSLTISQKGFLQSASLRQQLRKKSMELICSSYEQIHATIFDSVNQYAEPESLAPRTPDKVRELIIPS